MDWEPIFFLQQAIQQQKKLEHFIFIYIYSELLYSGKGGNHLQKLLKRLTYKQETTQSHLHKRQSQLDLEHIYLTKFHTNTECADKSITSEHTTTNSHT